MPGVEQHAPVKSGSRHVEGGNGYVRRLFFPHLPPTKRIEGVVYFPSGVGRIVPIPVDEDSPPLLRPGVVGSEFLAKSGTSFVAAVSELGDVSPTEAKQAVAEAAGVAAEEIGEITVRELGRAIISKQLNGTKQVGREKMEGVSFGKYVETLASYTDVVDSEKTLRTIAEQTGVGPERLHDMPLVDLRDHLDVLNDPPAPVAIARSSGTTACASSGGSTRCAILTGIQEDLLWGFIIGGTVGGALGALIGSLLGALWSLL